MGKFSLQIIPNSNPPVRFKLNHNSTRLAPGEIDTSIWVGDLTPEVDDFALYRYFTTRYGTVRCAKVEQRFPSPRLNTNQTDFLAGRLGRVRLQQGLRVREVRLRGRAAARPGLDDRGDGAGQQADQGLDGQPEEPGGERRRPVPSPRGYLQLGRSLCLAGPAEHCHQWLAGTCWQPSGSSSTSARRGLLAGHGWSLLPWQRGLGSPGSSNLARA